MSSKCRVTVSVDNLFRVQDFQLCGDVAKYKIAIYKNEKCVAIYEGELQGKTQVKYFRSHAFEVEGDCAVLLYSDSRIELVDFSNA